MSEPKSEISKTEIEASYDRVADEYGEEFFDELARKPFDRQLLDRFAAMLAGAGEVCEIGCGPGQVARHLRDRGLEMQGIDLSEEMVNCARRLNPDISFQKGDMLALDLPDASLAGIVCFYAIIHIPRSRVVDALSEMYRVLRPEGRLLFSFHGGTGNLHRDEWYGHAVDIDVTLFEKAEMSRYLEAAGFEVESIEERQPYDFEYPTPRLYGLARKPAPI